MHIFEKNCMYLGKMPEFQKSNSRRFCTGKCVKFSYIYIKNAIIFSFVIIYCTRNIFFFNVYKKGNWEKIMSTFINGNYVLSYAIHTKEQFKKHFHWSNLKIEVIYFEKKKEIIIHLHQQPVGRPYRMKVYF